MRLSRAQRAGRSTRAYALLGAIALTLIVSALFLGGTPRSSAQTTGTCTLPNAGITTCSFVTSTNVPAGGSMTISLTNPTGAVITALPDLPPGCGPVTSLPNNTVTVTCAVASLGIPFPASASTSTGTTIEETVSGVGANVPFVTQTVTYNSNGPAPTDSSIGSCAPALTASASNTTCTNIPPQVTTAGGTLTLTVTAAPGQSISVTGDAPPGTNTCARSTLLPTTPGSVAAVTYSCAAGQMAPALPFGLTVANAPTFVAGTPTETTTVNVLALTPVSTGGTCTGTLTFSCTNTPGATTVAGGTLSLAITAAPSQTILVPVGGAPPAGTCSLSTLLPTGVSFPGSTITIVYTCAPGEMVPAANVGPIIVISVNGVGGAPTEVTTVNAPSPLGIIPVPTTESVVFSVEGPPSPTATPVTGQALTVTLQADNAGNGNAGQLVNFTAQAHSTNTSAMIVKFFFSFGDGGSTAVTPIAQDSQSSATVSHVYSGPGPFVASVLAVDSTGANGAATAQIAVLPTASYLRLYQGLPPGLASAGTSVKVTLTASPLITGPGQPITFTYTAATQVNPALSAAYTLPPSNNGSTPQTLSINFGDGTPAQTAIPKKTIVHTYASPGAYTATLLATDNLGNVGQAMAYLTITAPIVQPPGNVAFSNPPSSGTVGSSVSFAAADATTAATCGTIATYSFDFGDGTASATGQTVSHTYTTAGTYTVTLTATDCAGSTGTATTTITISSS